MKKHKNLFILTGALLLISALGSAGCMKLLAATGRAKSYTADAYRYDASSAPLPIRAPASQTELRQKYHTFIHETENGKTAQIFSEEEYAGLKYARDSGRRSPLAQEEVLFLIQDSITLYQTYDQILLTNAIKDRITSRSHIHREYDDQQIEPYHGDFSEYTDKEQANQAYQKMIADIFSILYYRIYLHDAGFVHVTDGEWNDGDAFYRNILVEEFPYEANSSKWTSQHHQMQVLLLDEQTDSKEAYKKRLSDAYQLFRIKTEPAGYGSRFPDERSEDELRHARLEAPLLVTYFWAPFTGTSSMQTENELYLIDRYGASEKKLFPTAELEAMKPVKNLSD